MFTVVALAKGVYFNGIVGGQHSNIVIPDHEIDDFDVGLVRYFDIDFLLVIIHQFQEIFAHAQNAEQMMKIAPSYERTICISLARRQD